MMNEIKLEEMELAYGKLSMWAYAAAFPSHKFSMPEFDFACKSIGRYGSGLKGPNEYQLRVPLLKQAYAKVKKKLEK